MHSRLFHSRRDVLSLGGGLIATGLSSVGALGQTRTPIKIVNSAGVLGGALQQVAREKRFADEFNLDVTYVNVADGAKIISGLLGGDGDICMWSGFPQVLPAIERGGKLKIVAGSLVVPVQGVYSAKPEIRHVKDLVGKTIGSGAMGSLLHQGMVAALRKFGIEEKQVQFVNIGSSPDVFRAVSRGVVDAGMGEVDVFDQQQQFGVHILEGGQLWDELPQFTWQAAYATEQTIATKRDVLVRALAAHAKLYRYVQTPESWDAFNRGRAAFAGKDEPVPARTYWNFLQTRKPFAVNLALTPAQIQWVQELNVSLGVQKQVVPFDQVADMSLANDAIKLIGEAK